MSFKINLVNTGNHALIPYQIPWNCIIMFAMSIEGNSRSQGEINKKTPYAINKTEFSKSNKILLLHGHCKANPGK